MGGDRAWIAATAIAVLAALAWAAARWSGNVSRSSIGGHAVGHALPTRSNGENPAGTGHLDKPSSRPGQPRPTADRRVDNARHSVADASSSGSGKSNGRGGIGRNSPADMGRAANTETPAPDTPGDSPVQWADDGLSEDDAWAAALAALLEYPESVAALDQAIDLAERLGRSDDLRRLLRQRLAHTPDDEELRLRIAALDMRLGWWVDAIDGLEALLLFQPEHEQALYNLAVARQRLGRLQSAREAWDQYLRLRCDNPDALAHRAAVSLDLGDWAAAAADCEAALRLEPGALDTRMNLALALARQDRLEEALEQAQRALERAPASARVLNRAAEIAWERRLSLTAGGEAATGGGGVSRGEESRAEQARSLVIQLCEQSLRLAADQPEVAALLERARADD